MFEKHPEAKGVFGLKNATTEQALDDYRVKAQALIIEDTIGGLWKILFLHSWFIF